MSSYNGQCPKCGTQIPNSAEVCCHECDLEMAVNNCLPAVFSDRTRYSVIVDALDMTNISHLKVIARVLGLNLLQARKAKINPPFTIIEDRATKIFDTLDLISQVGIQYHVDPDFRWKKADTRGIISRD